MAVTSPLSLRSKNVLAVASVQLDSLPEKVTTAQLMFSFVWPMRSIGGWEMTPGVDSDMVNG